MSVGFNFGDYFGIEVPEEKKVEKKVEKKKVAKTETKKNAKKKEKEEKKYSLPAVVHSEWGDLVAEGLGEVTIADVKKKLSLPKCIKIIEKDNELFAMDDLNIFKNLKKDESVEGMVFINGQWLPIPEAMSIPEALKFIVESYPELPIDNIELCSVENGKYAIKFTSPVNMSLKLYNDFKIGFCGNLVSMENMANPMISLKEATQTLKKDIPWLSKVTVNWYFNANGKAIVGKMVDDIRKEDKALYIKLPVAIRFIHDAGPLKDGLTSEMFDGKEYVTEKDIMKMVLKYFPDVYKENNTDISYADSVNTVCVLRQGRSKGAGSFVGELNSNNEYVFSLPKMPGSFLDEITDFFIEMLPNEAIVQIAYDIETKSYRIIKPEAKSDTVSVDWNDLQIMLMMKPSESVVCEIHSHNTMPAFFSCVDDADEKIPMIYGVFGKLDGNIQRVFRAKYEENFYPIEISDIFNA